MTGKHCLTVLGTKDRSRVGIGSSNALRSLMLAHTKTPPR